MRTTSLLRSGGRLHRGSWPLAALTAALLLAIAAPAQAFTLDASSRITIESRGFTGPEAALPQELLERHLLRRFQHKSLEGAGPAVAFVLEAEAAVWQESPRAGQLALRDIDAFEIEITDQPRPTVRIAGASVQAVSFGVMAFLDEDLGVTWLFPGELGTVWPGSGAVELKPGLRRIVPAVPSRLYTGVSYADREAMLAFRQRFKGSKILRERFFESYDYFKSLRLDDLASPSHNMINIFPVKETRAKHPELFPTTQGGGHYDPPNPEDPQSGKLFQAWHPCYTNPKAVEIAIAKAREEFDAGKLTFSLGINDGKRVQCQCEDCRKAGWPGSYYQFVAKVAEALKKDYPTHLVGVLVYGDVRDPAPALHLPDNVLAMITGRSPMSLWSQHAKHLGYYGYFYGDGFGPPNFPLASMRHNAEKFGKFGVEAFRAEAEPIWAFDGPKMYIQSRMLWDAGVDADRLLARYCEAAFGREAAPAMIRFHKVWARQADGLAKAAGEEQALLCDFALWRNSSAQYAAAAPASFEEASQALKEARAAVKGEAESQRLDMVETCFAVPDAESRGWHLAQAVFAGMLDEAKLTDAARALHALAARVRAAEAKIAEHPAWRLGAGKPEERDEWTVTREMRSGMLTALAALSAPARTALAHELQEGAIAAALARAESPTPLRVKPADKGAEWSHPENQPRFTPMPTALDGDWMKAHTVGPAEQVLEGTHAGEWKGQWALALVPLPAGTAAGLHRIELEIEGAKGSASLQVSNPWRPEASDGLPVQSLFALGDVAKPVRRSIVVAPIGADSAKTGGTQMRIGILFTPRETGAVCEFRLRVTRISAPPAARPSSTPAP
ncbi:MAG: DUF4838 domain-containing protein [Planctomycetota bacterium]|nr:DUF4838 domain-containing protein [Planctomycetota bacterium]